MNTKKIGAVLIYFFACIFIISGGLKIIGVEAYVEMINELSSIYGDNIILLGCIAILSGILLLFKQTFTFGFIASLVFLGGTIAAHMQHGDNYIPQLLFVIILVLASYLKNKQWFQTV